MNESCHTDSTEHTFEHPSPPSCTFRVMWRVMSRIRSCDMTHPYTRDVWHDSLVYVTWLSHMCDMTHSHVWHEYFIRVHDTFEIHLTCLIHWCDMTYSFIWHDSFIQVTWLLQRNKFLFLFFIFESSSLLSRFSVMSHVIHMDVSCHTYEWVMSHIWMSHVIHMDVSCHTSCHTYTFGKSLLQIPHMGWLWLAGSLKL